MQLLLIGFAEVKVLCTGKNQTPVSSGYGQVNVEAMLGRYNVREGSHRGLCCGCVNDYVDLCVPMRETLLEAESVLYGWRDRHEYAFDVLARSGFDVTCACTMRSRVVVGPQTKVVQKCMLSAQFGVERHAMCAHVIVEVVDVDVAAVGEVEHDTVIISRDAA